MSKPVTQLGPNLYVYHGPVNSGVLVDGEQALLIDCGAGVSVDGLRSLGVSHVARICFTHHHRDQACGAFRFRGARLSVPAEEAALFEDAASWWADAANRWHLYDERPHHWTLTASLPVNDLCQDGDAFRFGQAKVTAIATPGHTDGHLAYLVETGGQRVVFSGDAIYGMGQVWDLYSLQKGTGTRDYHGFMGDRERLVASLQKVLARQPDLLVPSHGPLIRDPAASVTLLVRRLDRCYRQYVGSSALRHYFPQMFAAYQGDPAQIQIGPGLPYPDWLHHIGTSWIIVSQDGACWVMDCGRRLVIHEIKQRQARAELGAVEGLWITHYHDDHVDESPRFVETFHCPVYADTHVAQVIERPLAWRLPCISPAQVRVDHPTQHGETWRWHEFTMSAYHLPGQTRYHGGLLVEGRGQRLFFVGDSFTMAGLDDYCAGNRNWLGHNVGFDACLQLVEQLAPDLMFNAHVDQAFAFSAQQLAALRANLAQRKGSFGEVVPWSHANFGLDEHWVRCDPYEQHVAAGEAIWLSVVITNHAATAQMVRAQPIWPNTWNEQRQSLETVVPAKQEHRFHFAVHVPATAAGRHVVPVDIELGERRLPQFREAIVVIEGERS